jgi:BlaI family penicillinase repressor
MPRPRSQEPTAGELEILKTLWDSGPAELAEICARLREKRPVATTTVATMLGVMLEKGLVKRSRGPRGYVWRARRSRQATATGLLGKLMDRVFEGSALRLVAHLLAEGRLSERERRQILDLLRETEGERGSKKGPGRRK